MTSPQKNAFLRYHPSAFLLAAQLILLILYAIFDGLDSERALISAFGVVILVLVVWVISRSSSKHWIVWFLAVPTFLLSLLSAYINDPVITTMSSLLEAGLYFYAAGSLISYMMSDFDVTTDELFAVGATFTLLAWGFAYLYLICQLWLPGSFISSIVTERDMTFFELLFFSFTNLSSTGLSDIVPAATAARVLCMVEQVAGIGYVAIVVSRLVGFTHQLRNRR